MDTLKRILSFSKKYIWYAVISVFFGGVSIVCANIMPKIQQLIIDHCLKERHFELLWKFALLYVIAILFRIGGFFVQKYCAELVAQFSVYDMRNRLFDHIQRLSFTYHDNTESGQLISRSTSDINTVQMFLSQGLVLIVQFAVMVVTSVIFSFLTCPKLAVAIFIIVPFISLYMRKYSQIIRPCFRNVQDQIGNMTAFISQNLLGIKVIKSYTREEDQTAKFTALADELYSRFIKTAGIMAIFAPLIGTFIYSGQIVIFFYGGYLAVKGQVTIGAIVAFIGYFYNLLGAINNLSNFITIIQNAMASGDRVFEILKTKPEKIKDGHIVMSSADGSVEFRNAGFTYSDGYRALSSINIKAEPGQMIGIIGKTGSGKTTLINLISRFYDVTEGEILIDGTNIKDYTIDSLRRHVGIVAQESFLFADTIRANISYPRNASDEEIEEAAKAADIHDFIMSLPEGYDTIIGERGVDLSGGQKQRLSIARALILNPQILIMDDSTSALDTQTEAQVQKAIDNLTEKRTTFMIAQRISSIIGADRIIVLDRGRIAESGTHEELIKLKGYYKKIFDSQLIENESSQKGGEA